MSSVVFDPNRAQVDSAYKAEVIKLYNQGELKFNSKNDEKIFKGLLSTSNDENQYQIEDDTSDNKTNVIRNKGTDKGHGIFDLTIAGGAMASATAIGLNAASGYSGALAQMHGCNSMATEIACITAFAIGTKYELTRPNKDEHKELETLKNSMETGDVELANALIKLQESEGEVEVIRDEVEQTQEIVDEELKTKQEELEKKQARIEELNTKAQSADGLTEEEKAELEALGAEVKTLQDEISQTQQNSTDDVEDKQDEIEEKQNDVEEASDVFNSVLDVANYAETFDEASKDSATLEAVAQGVNAAMGFGAAAALTFHSPKLFLTPYGQVMRGLALAGAGMSTHGTIEQGIWAKDMGEEIDVRKDVQLKGEDAVEQLDEANTNIEETVTSADDVISELEEVESAETQTNEVALAAANELEPMFNLSDGDNKKEDDEIKAG